jgi:hypothetical protein
VALASDAIDLGGSDVIDVNGGSGAWTALGVVVVASLAILVGTIAAVVSWLGALLNTWQLEDKLWFGSLLALGLLGFGAVAMIAYVVAGPDGTEQNLAPPGIAGCACKRVGSTPTPNITRINGARSRAPEPSDSQR